MSVDTTFQILPFDGNKFFFIFYELIFSELRQQADEFQIHHQLQACWIGNLQYKDRTNVSEKYNFLISA